MSRLQAFVESVIEKKRKGIQVEGTNLDLKRSWWDGRRGLSEFVKDICAMANTTGGESLIVVGVDQKGKLHNACLPEDEANIQAKHKDKIEPRVKLDIEQLNIEEKTITVIVIPHSRIRPHVILRHQSKKSLRKNYIPVRFGSSTEAASRKDLDEMYAEREVKEEPDVKVDFFKKEVKWSNFVGYGRGGGNAFGLKLTIDNHLGKAPDYVTRISLVEKGGENWKTTHFWIEGKRRLDGILEVGAGKIMEVVSVYVSDREPDGLTRDEKPNFDDDRLFLEVVTRSGKKITKEIKPAWIMSG